MPLYLPSKLLFFCVLLGFSTVSLGSDIVQVDGGTVSGVEKDGIASYKGIPYARPPVAELRWRPPQPALPWENVLEADSFSAYCVQGEAPWPMPEDMTTSEDCLYLNIWTESDVTSPSARPVMFWIHGGGFAFGSGNLPRLDGTELARQGVVVVTFNYRLGHFGAFAHPEMFSQQADEPIGNYHLMDQLAALHWVKDNIAEFGGDPENITIFGESAGGVSVSALLVSPAAKGLFHKAIVQSGYFPTIEDHQSLVSVRGGSRSLESEGERLLMALEETLGFIPEQDVMTSLRRVPAEVIANTELEGTSFMPVEDGGSLLPGLPDELISAGRQHKVPLLLGITSWDGGIVRMFGQDAQILPGIDESAAVDIFESSPGCSLNEKIFGDMMLASAMAAADQMSNSGEDVYLYYFSYVARYLRWLLPGAPHASDINYVFDTMHEYKRELGIPFYPVSQQDKDMAAVMSRYWVQFAKTGNPNGSGLPHWPVYSAESRDLLELGQTTEARKNFHRKQLDVIAELGTASGE